MPCGVIRVFVDNVRCRPSKPVFEYDGSGTMCLNTLSDFIKTNNPEGLTAPAWKDKHWAKPLGLESTQWGRGNDLPCGGGCKTSCRDAARVGLLFGNNGYWEGYGQFLTKEYATRAQTWIFPGIPGEWGEYGYDPCYPSLPGCYPLLTAPVRIWLNRYLLWLWVTDDVDPTYSNMNGANGQCTSIVRRDLRQTAHIASLTPGVSYAVSRAQCGHRVLWPRHRSASCRHAPYSGH